MQTFLGEPYRYAWGIGALLLDQDGSPILLQQEVDEVKLGSDAVAWAQDRSFDSG